ncbi:MAG: hypothetical protein A2481_00670 [Candidatus Yonathbacteria bacterium RIFOXYC2_FULL_47_9]|nr:MAG: hypothetical protein A2481_00670 [Candidatus Yonathbacteria bacterium RIFOXYC2_FULL_47_9]
MCGTGTLVSSASSFNKGDLGVGSHTIYFRVKDSQNAWSTNCPSRTITVSVSCGTATDADGSTYNTVAIGTQCWMKESMRVGTMINSGTTQTNNGTIEKYCYNNQAANCTTNHPNYPDGGLYTWNEAMKYSVTEGAQGICPAGWHIPTDADWHTLENYLKDSGQVCNPNRDETLFGFVGECSSAGLKLKPGGASGFEGNLAGLLSVSAGGSAFRDMNGMFWSSSQVPPAQALGGSPHAWDRMLNFGKNTVYRAQGEISSSVTIPVRCVQNSSTKTVSLAPLTSAITLGQSVTFSSTASFSDGSMIYHNLNWRKQGSPWNWDAAYTPVATATQSNYTFAATTAHNLSTTLTPTQTGTYDVYSAASANGITWISSAIATITVSAAPCANGATNPPACNHCAAGYSMYAGTCYANCANGTLNPPLCNLCPGGQTFVSGSCVANCVNGATNPPACNNCPTGQSLVAGVCTVTTVCGDGICNVPETLISCPKDCKAKYQQF